ncbi:PAS domain-containing sensor histidine kinase [Desulfobulbus alkaliphilus]|uniref:PAS domain-containing sensor histidine kinase n=1 Tax=Desulfobulbus alkaliphilus TaxID=869814 RepID=UPI0019625272|nr:PAS domain-containing sensor histidine kinase [Desulfobulbus alkaliphilus]MBM9538274.1 PAS domain S-box protein [Desulfobulbus alkaliphilus]
MSKDKPDPDFEDLRKRAEALARSTPDNAAAPTPEAYRQIIQELQIHQIELELQNEELRNTQRALEESRTRYMQLYHNAPVGYVVLNRAGIITEANATFADMVDRDRGRLLGRPFADFLFLPDQAVFLARAKAFFKHPEGKILEFRIGATAPTARYVSLKATPHYHHQEQRLQHHQEVLLTVTDINDRKQAEQALRDSEQFARSTVNALDANIAILGSDGRIVAVNQAWRNFARDNHSDPEKVSEGVNYLTPCHSVRGHEATEAENFANGIIAVLRGDRENYYQEYACHSPEENRWFIGRVTRFPYKGANRVVVAHENITHRKQLENENLLLQHQINQREKEESLGRMAGAIAHHYNNILSVIMGNLELALDDAPPNSTLHQTLSSALNGTNRAAEISGKMLTYLGMNTKRKKSFDLSVVCRQTLPLLLARKPEPVRIETDFTAPGPAVLGNPEQLQEIVINLTENSWEALGAKNDVIHLAVQTVAAADIEPVLRFPLSWQPKTQTYGMLEVRDQGCGISEHEIDKIFDPFFSGKFMGRGMGLALVLGILRAHDGCITVTSQPDQGTTVRVYIPVHDRATGN